MKKPSIDADFFASMIADAEIQQGSRYFEPGVYLVQIDNCKFFANRHGRPRAAVDCTVVGSNNVNFPKTSQVTWVVSLDTDSGPNTVKTFIASLFKVTNGSDIKSADVNNIFVKSDSGKISSASGMHAMVNVYNIKTLAQKDFTKCEWRHFDIEKDAAPDFANMPRVGEVAALAIESDVSGVSADGSIPF